MKPEDLIADLRDIHEPMREIGTNAALSFVPFVIFALIVAVAWFWSRRRAGLWRRQATERLRTARAISDPDERWKALVELFQKVSRIQGISSPPDYLFRPGAAESDLLANELAAEIARRID